MADAGKLDPGAAGARRRAVRGRAVPPSIGLIVVFLVLVMAPASPLPEARPPTAAPRAAEPCQLVQRYRVSFLQDAGGTWVASFPVAGGATRGRVTVPETDVPAITRYDAYVADVRLGSYEPADAARPRGRLACAVDPTYHFYCLANGAVDQFCLVWLPRPAPIGR